MSSDCPSCKGVGFFYPNVAPSTSPGTHYGRAESCRTCDGYGTVNRYELALREESGISPEMAEAWTGEAFDEDRTPAAAEAFAAMLNWCGPPPSRPFLVLLGTVGTGKTHLAVAAAQYLIADHTRCYFATVPRLLGEMRETNRPGSTRSLDQMRSVLEDIPALILDDLGADRTTDFATEQLFLLIDERWQKRRRTLVTSNTVAAAGFEARIRSRLFDTRISRVVECSGPDQRQGAQS